MLLPSKEESLKAPSRIVLPARRAIGRLVRKATAPRVLREIVRLARKATARKVTAPRVSRAIGHPVLPESAQLVTGRRVSRARLVLPVRTPLLLAMLLPLAKKARLEAAPRRAATSRARAPAPRATATTPSAPTALVLLAPMTADLVPADR